MKRRLALTSALLAAGAVAMAQTPPARTLCLMVPFATGTSPDIVGCTLAHALAAQLNQTVIIKNKPGVGSTIGADMVAKSGAAGQAVLPHIRPGKQYTPGASSARRSAAAPDVPTLIAQGAAGLAPVTWFRLYAPSGMPTEQRSHLQDATRTVLALPEVHDNLAAQGGDLAEMNGAEMAAFGTAEIAKWGETVKRSGAQVG